MTRMVRQVTNRVCIGPVVVDRPSRSGQGRSDERGQPGEDQQSDDRAANDLDPLQLRLHLGPESINLAFKLRLGCLQFLLNKHDVALCRDPAGNTGMNRGRDRFGMRLLNARTAKALDRGDGVERDVGRHVGKSFLEYTHNTRHVCKPVQRVRHFQTRCGLRHTAPALSQVLALVLALVPAAHAQVRPVGAPSMSQEAIQDRLGPCPVEELREAWSDMEAVERAAVEQEVIRLCTERAVLVREFLAAHRDLRAALGELVPELPAPVAGPGVSGAGDASSVAVPDADAEGPELAATGDIMSDDPGPASEDASFPLPGPGGEPVEPLAGSLGFEEGKGAPNPPGEPAVDQALQAIPPPGAVPPPDDGTGLVTAPDEAAEPAAPAGPSWEVVFTARRSDGSWLAMVRETDPPPVVLPAIAQDEGEESAAPLPVLAPRPPESVLVSEGEPLAEDGPVVLRIDGAGVEIALRSEGDSVVLPWASGAPALEPGRPDFLYVKEGESATPP